MIGQILSSLTGLATSWLDSTAQQKREIDWEIEAIRFA